MNDQTRRAFLKQAAMGTAAVLAYPTSTVLGANDRVRVGMIGVGDRDNDLLGQIRSVHGVELVAMADVYSRRQRFQSRHSDRIAASEFRRADRRQAMDQRRMGRQSHAGRILDEPQHAP